MVLLKDQTMTPATLPIAVGGNGRLDYTITPALPAGLSFNPATRVISGEPTATSTATTYTYTVTDSDATGPDTDTITFRIEVADTGISVTGLRSPVYEGESIAFTVTVTNVPTIGAYDLDVTAYGAANTTSRSTNSDIGFNSTCSDVAESDDATAGAATQSESHTLHVCDSEYNGGGIITMALVDDDDNVLVGDWSAVEAKPITVSITADNPFPVTGDTTVDGGADTVTLTAVTDAPTGTTFTYQWQQKSGSSWSDIASATNSTYKMADETSSTTKTIRVKATSGNTTYTSGEVSITWNLGQTLREISDALTDGLTAAPTPTAFQDAEGDLLDCVEDSPTNLGGGTRYTSCAHLMTKYESGSTLATLLETEDDQTVTPATVGCKDDLDDAWDEIEDSFTDTLNSLRTTGTNATAIDAFLDSSIGQTFISYMTERNQIENTVQDVVVPASKLLSIPTTLSRTPRDGDGDGEDFVPICYRIAGLAYSQNASAEERKKVLKAATIDQRLATLNCLAFSVPHSYWIDLARPIANPDADQAILVAYKSYVIDEDDSASEKEGLWLDGMDFECTWESDLRMHYTDIANRVIGFFSLLPVIPTVDITHTPSQLAGCLKHDLAFGSLRLIDDSASDDEPDTAWNPRNKHLADALFYADAVCLAKVGVERRNCLTNTQEFWDSAIIRWFRGSVIPRPIDEATTRTWAVAQSNNKGWPVTAEHISHVKNNPRYVTCSQPIPEIDTENLFAEKVGEHVIIRWIILNSCVEEDIWKVVLLKAAPRDSLVESVPAESPTRSGQFTLTYRESINGIRLRGARITPINWRYGATVLEIDFVVTVPPGYWEG